MNVHPLAGQPAPSNVLVDVAKLIAAYYDDKPDPDDPSHRVSFGTSGHRGSSFRLSFNEAHILATTQAICDYRRAEGIDGPLYIGIDTHALSEPAAKSALEVLAANGVETCMAPEGHYTPTPAISFAIYVLTFVSRENMLFLLTKLCLPSVEKRFSLRLNPTMFLLVLKLLYVEPFQLLKQLKKAFQAMKLYRFRVFLTVPATIFYRACLKNS